jgi:hypothetical protein
MTDNLPESHGSDLEVSRFDPAVFTDAGLDRLRSFNGADLKELAQEVGRDGGNAFAHIRKCAGLVAWAGWFKFSSHEYVDFVADLAGALGFESDTVLKWRREVVKSKKLPVPGVAKVRSDAAIASRKPAGQTASAGQPSGKSAPIPATFTEVPSKKSEGGEPRGDGLLGQRGRSDSDSGAGTRLPSSGPLPEPSPVAPQGVDDAGGSGNTPATPDENPLSSGVAAILNERDVIGYLQGHTDAEVRAIGAPFRLAWENEIRRWATLLGISPASLLRGEDGKAAVTERRRKTNLVEPNPSMPSPLRQGTVSRPPASSNGKREVTPMFKGGK